MMGFQRRHIMRAHSHQYRAHPIRTRAVVAVHPGHDAVLATGALVAAMVVVVTTLAGGWAVGGFVLQAVGVAA